MMNNLGSSKEQWDTPQETMKQKRGEFLFAIIVLSWFSQGSAFISTLFTLSNGRAKLEESANLINEAQNVEMPFEWLDTALEAGLPYITVLIENFYRINLMNLLVVVTGAFGVFLMYKLKKIGFVFYILYCALELGVVQYYFGHISTTIFSLFTTGLVSALFIILYGVNLKRMTE